MDSDLWISRLAAAKRHYSLLLQNQNRQLDRLGFNDLEVEEEIRGDFSCPYCYDDHDFMSLCAHLEEEHSLESKLAPCPICSVKVQRDMLNHVTLQHGHLFKRRHRLRRVAVPSTQSLSLLGRDLREAHLQVLLGSGGYRSGYTTNASTAVADSLLSSVALNFPTLDPEETVKSFLPAVEDACFKKATPARNWKLSLDSSLSHEEREQRRRRAAVRASFAQHLLVSTLFGD
ncbi:protein DEHYDRATION-INDUCED 19-like [Ananas comosus]|uniref:Protein DEHYDRATION-INDUCED 19 n=1 Tax=Ananas comosus TaxID=4615 RepID=A0A199W411_ANACO|nr:protein DEHYDRATION-INDUCED 19-like [Ananas comosus]OAY84222.1 Protein DEHYDRATION-INDUCED 19 [Ananas comosus]